MWETVRVSLAFAVNLAFTPKEMGSSGVSTPSKKTSSISWLSVEEDHAGCSVADSLKWGQGRNEGERLGGHCRKLWPRR